MKTMKALVLVALTFTLPAFGQKIKTIRVAPLVAYQPGGQEYADMINAKLISHLVKAGVSVVENGADSEGDAVLAVQYQFSAVDVNGVMHYRFEGPVRLTDNDGKILWADDVKNSVFARSASSSFAENVARKVEAFLSSQK